MRVYLAYFSVVIIWSTTPLAIQMSNDSLSYMSAVTGRMLIALVIAMPILLLMNHRLFEKPGDWKVHLAASIGIFPNMFVVYWAAQFIPSGLIAVVFGMSPFITGLLTILILKENPFTKLKVAALCLSLFGLVFIFHDQIAFGPQAVWGVLGILLSGVIFSTSSVLLKKFNRGLNGMTQTTGSLLFAAPGMVVSWLIFDGVMPTEISWQSLAGVSYLSTMGSIVGFSLFFFVLHHFSASTVSLITLMTPILALMVGAIFNGERFSPQLLQGTGLIVMALILYQGLGIRTIKSTIGRLRLSKAS